MKKTLLGIIMLSLFGIVTAQDAQKIVVLEPFGNVDNSAKQTIKEEINKAIENSPEYVNVAGSVIDQAFETLNNEKTTELNDLQISKLGQQAGADFVFYFFIQKIESDYYVSLKMINSTTEQVAIQKTGTTDNLYKLIPVVEKLSSQLLNQAINPSADPYSDYQTKKAKSDFDYDRKAKSLQLTIEKEHQSEGQRQSWMQSGGSIGNQSYLGGITILSGDGITGYGGNFSYSNGQIFLAPPEYKTGISTWHAFTIAAGGDVNFNSIQTNMDGFSDYYSLNTSLSIQLGFAYAVGRFRSENKWKGNTIEFNYKPSYNIYIPFDGSDGSDSFSWTSFSVGMSRANFESTITGIAPKAGYKFTLFVIPPFKKDGVKMPLFISIGLGWNLYY